MGIIRSFVITFLSLLVLSWVLPAISYASIPVLILASVILTILQKFVQPALKILFLPINIVTLGIFSWVVDVLILWGVILLVPGFHIDQVSILGIHFSQIFSIVFVSFAISLAQSLIQIVF